MSSPVRQTRQRTAVKAILGEVDGFQSAQQLHALITARGEAIGLATVYRCLQALELAGEVDAIVGPDGETRYRRCSGEHHHHLVCRACGRTVEVQTEAVEEWVSALARDHGFTEVDHSFELVGLCTSCAGKSR